MDLIVEDPKLRDFTDPCSHVSHGAGFQLWLGL